MRGNMNMIRNFTLSRNNQQSIEIPNTDKKENVTETIDLIQEVK
jgi:hypothetical protein